MATRIKWRIKGFRELRQDMGVADDLERRAEDIADACNDALPDGGGYQSTAIIGKNRARASVITTNFEAIYDNYKNATLIRNLDAGRDYD